MFELSYDIDYKNKQEIKKTSTKRFLVCWVSLCVLAVLSLSGCGLFETRTRTVKEDAPDTRTPVPAALTVPCTVTPPITINKFLDLSIVEQNFYLTGYINVLLLDLDTCDKKVKTVRKWDIKQEELFNDKKRLIKK